MLYTADQRRIPATSAHQRGLDCGRQFRSQIAQAAEEYTFYFRTRGISAETQHHVVESSVAETEAFSPDLARELEGLAEGSGTAFGDVVALNARTEILAAAPASGPGECSTAVLLPGADSLEPRGGAGIQRAAAPQSVQTWDWVASLSRELLVRKLTSAAGLDVVTLAEFGQLGKIGLNSAGLGVYFNILHHTDDGGGSGVPVHLIARRILDEASTVEQAHQITQQASVAASTVITVISLNSQQNPNRPSTSSSSSTSTGPGNTSASSAHVALRPEAACLEISPAGVAVIPAEPGQPLLHTNHFLDPQLAAGGVNSAGSTTWDRYHCAIRIAEHTLAAGDPFDRAQRFTAEEPIDVTAPSEVHKDQHVMTKATVVLDLQHNCLQCCLGSASRVTRDQWLSYPLSVVNS